MNPIFFALVVAVAINAASLRAPAPAAVQVVAPAPIAQEVVAPAPAVVEESPRTYIEDWLNAHPQVRAKFVRVAEVFQATWKKIAAAGPPVHAFFAKIWEAIMKLIDNLKEVKYRQHFEKTIAAMNNGFHHVGKAFERVKEIPAHVVDVAKRVFANVKEGYAPVHGHVTRAARHVRNQYNNFRQSMTNLWKTKFRHE